MEGSDGHARMHLIRVSGSHLAHKRKAHRQAELKRIARAN